MKNMPEKSTLLDKVILIIGYDTADTNAMIQHLARKGADVALICWQMNLESIIRIKDTVQSLGKRFLLIERARNENFSSAQLIKAITAELGRLDAIIDLSSQIQPETQPNEETHPWVLGSTWPITKAALETIAQPG